MQKSRSDPFPDRPSSLLDILDCLCALRVLSATDCKSSQSYLRRRLRTLVFQHYSLFGAEQLNRFAYHLLDVDEALSYLNWLHSEGAPLYPEYQFAVMLHLAEEEE